MLSKEEIWDCISKIPDPDIPVVSITDLGLVRNVITSAGTGPQKVIVSVTPSYSGCPAMQLFKDEITSVLKNKGIQDVEIKTVFSPAWSSDWISPEGKEKMKKHGIAPPETVQQKFNLLFSDSKKSITCPRCNSTDTKLTSQFGSTPCKSLWFCNSCNQPFEHFKCI